MKSLFALASVAWLILSWSSSAQAKLQIENIQASYGPFGPERKSLDLYPFDILFLRFTVTGLKTDAAGKVDTAITLKWADAKGNPLDETSFPSSGILHLGGNSFLAFVHLRMPGQVPVGKNTVTVAVTDNLSKESASFERQMTGHKSKLQVVDLEFFHDADGKLPSSTNCPPGEPLHFRLRVIGFDRSKEKIHIQMAVQTLDSDGKENLPKPLVFDFREQDAKAVQRTNFVFFTSGIGLNRVGKFTLRITITDRLTDQSTKMEVPVTVAAPRACKPTGVGPWALAFHFPCKLFRFRARLISEALAARPLQTCCAAAAGCLLHFPEMSKFCRAFVMTFVKRRNDSWVYV